MEIEEKQPVATTVSEKARRRGFMGQMLWAWRQVSAHHKAWFRFLLPASVLVALCMAVVLGGPIGDAKVDYIHYAPYHEVNLLQFVGYVVGGLVLALLLVWWRSDVFLLLAGKETGPLTRKERVVSALRCLQLSLLHLLTFGIPLGVALWLMLRVSLWFAILLGVLCLVLLPALCLASCRYMWSDDNYRAALRYAFSSLWHFGGRTLLLLVGIGVVALCMGFVVLLPAMILLLVVYDAQVAVVMGEGVQLPWLVRAAEYVFLWLGTAGMLGVCLWAYGCLRGHYDTLHALDEQRRQTLAEARRYEAEQERLKRFTRQAERELKA